VTRGPPKRLSGLDILTRLNECGNRFEGFETEHNWTHKYRLWDLPYVKALILMRNIDVTSDLSLGANQSDQRLKHYKNNLMFQIIHK
jgi:hypothetical protein